MQLLFAIILSAVFLSCSISRKFASGNYELAKEGTGEFVQLNQGKVMEKARIVSSTKKNITLDGGLTLEWDEISAYQTKDAYYGPALPSWSKQRIFIPRVIKGHINVYRNSGTSGTMTGVTGSGVASSVYYIQKGNTGLAVKLTAGNLKSMVQDYEPAFNIIRQLGDKVEENKKLEEAILSYNAK